MLYSARPFFCVHTVVGDWPIINQHLVCNFLSRRMQVVEYLPRIRTLNIVTKDEEEEDESKICVYTSRPPDRIQVRAMAGKKQLMWRNIDVPDSLMEKQTHHPRLSHGIYRITCKRCSNTISAEQQFAVKQLPSEHWTELVECWSCHRDEFAGVGQQIEARPSCILEGVDHVLIHVDDGKDRQCKCQLFTEASTTIRLDKDDICISNFEWTFEACFAASLKALIDAHGGWKFSFAAPEKDEFIWVWVVAWDILYAEDSGMLRPALKVAFSETRQSADDTFEMRFESTGRLQKIKRLFHSESTIEPISIDGQDYSLCYLRCSQ